MSRTPGRVGRAGRIGIVSAAAGAVVLCAVAGGAAAFADGQPTPSASAETGGPTPAAPGGAEQGAPSPGQQGAGPSAPGHGPADAARGPGGRAHEPHIDGDVRSVSGRTVTVRDHDGFTRTIHLGSGATVTKQGAASSTSAITTGQHIDATGSVASDGTTLNATRIEVGRPTPPAGGPAAGAPAAGQEKGRGGARTAPAAPSAPPAPDAPGPSAGTGGS